MWPTEGSKKDEQAAVQAQACSDMVQAGKWSCPAMAVSIGALPCGIGCSDGK